LKKSKDIIEEAKKLEKHCKFKEALDLLEDLFRKEPDSKDVKKALIACLLSYGGYLNDEFSADYEKAISCYEKMIEIDPESYRAFYNLGITHFNLGNIEKALESYNKALKIKPDYKYCYYNIGYLYESQGELDKAMQFYEKALNIDPRFVYALNARESVRKLIDALKRSG
jgi:tetratricopeptide (TPR) repeat protein